MAFTENDSQHHRLWLSVESSKEFVQKNLDVTLLFGYIFKASDSQQNMEQIILAYGLSLQTVTGIMLLYEHTKSMVYLTDSDADFFEGCRWSLVRRYISS